ncbi:hypothetical protein AWH56_017870 [Anaerobacillus isosaccharinicus]|uniref:Uncharacterized protein n=1 Tax=Anaerobacillus isosaccharinicus TaxID=1532552 RepID=A0A1S2M955_9BACI|nr:hypothetical protein [Anaerobacillus isosaccharinicus]MBA5587227.1 hypothetical protein [Anaerobacillus isosaccharinicus]QOY34579.1 hypothetical protein AWH56_017870 [Anaerobacillus isosaccharinicus]
MLNELDGVQLGPIFLSFSILSLGVSMLFAYIAFAYLVKKNAPSISNRALNTIQTSGLIFLVTYKLMPFMMHPSYLLSPSKLLIYAGGPFAVQLSALVSLIYFSYCFYKEKWSFKLVDYLAISGYIFLILDSILIKKYGTVTPLQIGFTIEGVMYHPLNLYHLVLYSLFFVTLFTLLRGQKSGVLAVILFIAYFFIKALISPFM